MKLSTLYRTDDAKMRLAALCLLVQFALLVFFLPEKATLLGFLAFFSPMFCMIALYYRVAFGQGREGENI